VLKPLEEERIVEINTEPFVLNIGPAHPSTHGVFRMRVVFDGEVVVDLEPMLGYLHRGIEKLAETRTYTQVIPLMDRFDYMAGIANAWPYCMAVEKLADIKVPERAEYIRVIVAELMRVINHTAAVGFMLNDMGAFFSPLIYAWREREKLVDLFDMLCGQRLTYNYFRIGGVSHDLPDLFLEKTKRFVAEMPEWLEEYENLLADNEIIHLRTKGTGTLSREKAINFSASGPVLRASGVKRDIRKDDPYSVYDRFDFDVVTGENGDNYDRYRVRVGEMWQSLKIVEQALKGLPPGEVQVKHAHFLRPPVGEVFAHIEAPKGEYGAYVVSDNSVAPYRFHVRPPTMINLTGLRDMIVGWKIADAILTLGTIDICLGEVDR
jgi:NADH-quinone oxidoreductase subunit D